jgi:hypothetical protein
VKRWGKLMVLAPISLIVVAGCSGTTKSASPPTSKVPSATTDTTTTTAPTATTASTTSIPSGPLNTVTIGQWTGSKPQTIYFSGDSGNIVTGITWSSWGPDAGQGEGTWHYDNCDPNCAAGTVTDYPASLTVSDPSAGQFTMLTEVQSGPYGQTQTFTLPDRALGGASSGTTLGQ